MKTIFRTRLSANFTILPNELLRDKSISFKARGMLAMVLSNREEWVVHHTWLASQGTEGREAISSGMRELERAGYAVYREDRDLANGQVEGAIWTFYDVPVPENDRSGKTLKRLRSNSDGNPQSQDRNGGKNLLHNNGKPSYGFPSDGCPHNGNPATKNNYCSENHQSEGPEAGEESAASSTSAFGATEWGAGRPPDPPPPTKAMLMKAADPLQDTTLQVAQLDRLREFWEGYYPAFHGISVRLKDSQLYKAGPLVERFSAREIMAVAINAWFWKAEMIKQGPDFYYQYRCDKSQDFGYFINNYDDIRSGISWKDGNQKLIERYLAEADKRKAQKNLTVSSGLSTVPAC